MIQLYSTPTARHVSIFWSIYWNNWPANFDFRFKSVVPEIPNKVSFHNLDPPKSSIVQFNSLRIGHCLIPSHAYKPNHNHNNSLLCTLHTKESISDLSHIQFDYPSLSAERLFFLNSLYSLNTPLNFSVILKFNFMHVIELITSIVPKVIFLIWFLAYVFLYYKIVFIHIYIYIYN